MNTLKLVALPITILVSFMILLLIISYLLKPLKAKTDEEGNIKLSYALWFGALFLSGCCIIRSILSITIEAIDNIIKIQSSGLALETMKTLLYITAIAFIWLLIWYFIIKLVVKITTKTSDEQELENNNVAYFLIKSLVLIGIVFCLSFILEMILKMTIPTINLPFYH